MNQIVNIRDHPFRRGDHFLLWAVPRGGDIPFEVSREVSVILEDRCPSSPYCPKERIPRIRSPRAPSQEAWEYVEDKGFQMDPSACPMGFKSKAECFREINIIAFVKGTVPREKLGEISAFLKSVGYRLFIEPFWKDEVSGERILIAHGILYNFHELRTELGPGGVRLYLVRNPYENLMPAEALPYLD